MKNKILPVIQNHNDDLHQLGACSCCAMSRRDFLRLTAILSAATLLPN